MYGVCMGMEKWKIRKVKNLIIANLDNCKSGKGEKFEKWKSVTDRRTDRQTHSKSVSLSKQRFESTT